MRLIPSDPDIETLLRRIDDEELDLQPDFQRGEVWSERKKRLLIDSILRKWHIPPIHIVETEDGEEVLDGQQRLVAIRDFYQGKLRVDGRAEPVSSDISELHNLTYHDLPAEYRRSFKRFGIRLFTIVDYSPDEAAELFYRLNQPVTLTSPEQRNAFFGPVRTEVRRLVEHSKPVFDAEFLGFSNSRMAWDDVIARVAYSLEQGTLRSKATAGRLANRYRERRPLSQADLNAIEGSLRVLAEARPAIDENVRFNKATLFSWLYFFAKAAGFGTSTSKGAGALVSFVEIGRQKARQESGLPLSNGQLDPQLMTRLLLLFHDRASSRVGDVFSVLARDFVLWASLFSHAESFGLAEVGASNRDRLAKVKEISETITKWEPSPAEAPGDSHPSFEEVLEEEISAHDWGVA